MQNHFIDREERFLSKINLAIIDPETCKQKYWLQEDEVVLPDVHICATTTGRNLIWKQEACLVYSFESCM